MSLSKDDLTKMFCTTCGWSGHSKSLETRSVYRKKNGSCPACGELVVPVASRTGYAQPLLVIQPRNKSILSILGEYDKQRGKP